MDNEFRERLIKVLGKFVDSAKWRERQITLGRERLIKVLGKFVDSAKWRERQITLGDADTLGMPGGYSDDLTEAIELLEDLKSGY